MHKNYKVTSWFAKGFALPAKTVYYYNWYWAANLRSWFEYNILDKDYVYLSVHISAKVKHRPVIWKS